MGMAWIFFGDSKEDIIGYTDILYKQHYLDFDDFGDMFAHGQHGDILENIIGISWVFPLDTHLLGFVCVGKWCTPKSTEQSSFALQKIAIWRVYCMLHSQTHPYSNPRLDAEEFRPILVEKFNLFYLWGSRLLWPSYGQAYKKWGFPWGFHGFNITRLGIASSMDVFPWGCRGFPSCICWDITLTTTVM